MDELCSNMLKVIDRFYINGLKKYNFLICSRLILVKRFPNSTNLRLNYAFFLLELMKSKTKALEQLEICEKGKTDFDEQFLIFRYK